MGGPRKSYPLRISAELYAQLRTWAEEEMRSVNSQMEFLLRAAVQKRNGKPSNGEASSGKSNDDQPMKTKPSH